MDDRDQRRDLADFGGFQAAARARGNADERPVEAPSALDVAASAGLVVSVRDERVAVPGRADADDAGPAEARRPGRRGGSEGDLPAGPQRDATVAAGGAPEPGEAVPVSRSPRPGLEMYRHNLRHFAKSGWPDGALDFCLRMTSEQWHVTWEHECTTKGFERPAGFRAIRQGYHEVKIYGPTAEGIERAIEQAPAEHSYVGCWCECRDVPRKIIIELDS
jgi:hypothetical protein